MKLFHLLELGGYGPFGLSDLRRVVGIDVLRPGWDRTSLAFTYFDKFYLLIFCTGKARSDMNCCPNLHGKSICS